MAASSPSYRGDSPSKKMARLLFWVVGRELMGESRFREGPHVVLASKDAGDVAALLSLGARPGGIIAVDTDAQACLDILDQYEGVKAINDDIFEVLKTYRRKAASIFFDFCGQPSLELVEQMAKNAAELPDRSYWGAAFSYGREREKVQEGYETMRQTLIAEVRAAEKRRLERGMHIVYRGPRPEDNGDDLLTYLEGDALKNPYDWRILALSQYSLLRAAHYTNIAKRRGASALVYTAQYVSGTEFSKGMPMLAFGAVTARKLPGESDRMAVKRFLNMAPEQGPLNLRIGHYSELDFRVWVVDTYDRFRSIGMSHADVARGLNIPLELLNTWVGEQP